jgi:hypothetical protein
MIRDVRPADPGAQGRRRFVDSTEPSVPPTAPAAGGEPVTYQAAPAVARSGAPGVVVASGVILLVLAVLALLWTVLFVYGALITSISSAVDSNPNEFGSIQFGPMAEAMRPVLYAVAFIIFCLALAHLAAGIGVLGRRSWARITGLVLAVLGLAANLIGLISVLVSAGSTRQQLLRNGVSVDPVPGIVLGAVIFITFGAAYFFVLITLARRGRDFV